MKPIADNLKSQLFARRRYHEAGNRPADTVEQRQKRERIETLVARTGAIVGTPIFIVLFVYMFHPKELPWWFAPSYFVTLIISSFSCAMLLSQFTQPCPSYGRWIIAFDGIFYRYGKSPHRFVPFAFLRNVRVESPKSGFAVVVFDTDQEPLRIGEDIHVSRKPTEFLPFLNYVIDRLRQNGWSNVNLTPLLDLQRIIQRRIVHRQCFQYTNYLMMACYFVPLLCILPLYSYIAAVPYPAILWVVAFCILVACLVGFALNSRLERWKNKKIDALIQTLAEREKL